jgi:hypothetical protein
LPFQETITMRIARSLLLIGLLALAGAATSVARAQGSPAPSAAEEAAIKAAALDYVEGWYEGNGERMARALHPELVKRIVPTHPKTGKQLVSGMGASVLINSTAAGGGKDTPKERQIKNITIFTVYSNVAIVQAEMSDWFDHMQLAKVDGQWKIVNVLWVMKPKAS